MRAHIETGFALVDECILSFNQVGDEQGSTPKGQFSRVCAITTTKGRNLLFACYSLSLDALAQESGAVLRPLIEVVELLKYLRLDPSRVDRVIGGKLPSAGQIRKSIKGSFQSLRDHLNLEASHFGFGFHSVRHLLDRKTLSIKATQSHSIDVLARNLDVLSAFLAFLLLESVSCLYLTDSEAKDLADRSQEWKYLCTHVFAAQRGSQNET